MYFKLLWYFKMFCGRLMRGFMVVGGAREPGLRGNEPPCQDEDEARARQ